MVESKRPRGGRVSTVLRMAPSLKARIENAAKTVGVSVNEVMISTLDENIPALPATATRPSRPSRPIETRVVE
jgi:predicted HicB family RNase H-like nuclease